MPVVELVGEPGMVLLVVPRGLIPLIGWRGLREAPGGVLRLCAVVCRLIGDGPSPQRLAG